jgi:hypothetical protein
MSPEARCAYSTPSAVVGSRDVVFLLQSMGHIGLDATAAVDGGVLVREKVEGVWLFARSIEALTEVAKRVQQSATAVCASWLLARVPPLVGTVTKELAGSGFSREAVQAHIRAELRNGNLGGLPLLTQDYQPYFAVFRLDDQPEIERQLAAVRSQLARTGFVRAGDLPEPELPRDFRAWRSSMLHHAEFLGLGRLVNGALVRWA